VVTVEDNVAVEAVDVAVEETENDRPVALSLLAVL